MKGQVVRACSRVVLPYVLFGIAWIVLSDAALEALTGISAEFARLSVFKGVAFVVVTALLLFVLLRAEVLSKERDRAALSESEARYRMLFEANPQPMWAYDVETLRFLAVNDAAINCYGWSRREFLSMTLADVRPPEEVPRLLDYLRQRSDGSARWSGPWRHWKRDGTVFDVENTSHPVVFEDRPARMVALNDISERVRAEDALRRSENFARGTLDSLPANIAIVDEVGTIIAVNRAWRRFAEHNDGEVAAICEGANYLHACAGATGEGATDAQAMADGIRRLLSGQGREFGREYPCHSPGKQRWFTGRASRMVGDGPPRVVIAHVDVTQRKLAEATAQTMSDRLRHFLNLSPNINYALRVDGHRLLPEWVSENVERVLGYPTEQTLQPDWWAANLHPDERSAAAAKLKELLREGTAVHEYRFRRADGTWLWVSDQMRVERDADGLPVRIVGAWTDVSERHEAQAALASSEARFRAAFEQAAVGMAHSASDDGRFLMCNQQLCDILGYTRKELLTRRVEDVTHPDDYLLDQRFRHNALGGQGDSYACEKRYVRKDGRTVWASTFRTLVRKADGSPAYFAGVIVDISERRAVEEQVQRLSQAIEQSSESFVITDAQGRIEYVNEAFTRVSGYSSEEVVGANPRVLQSGRTPRESYAAMWAALNAGRSWRGEFHNRRKDGSEYLEAALISPIRQADGRVTHFVAAKEDITARRRIEMELEEHRHRLEDLVAQRTSQLEEARALADAASQAKSAFLANMSHEIRTPMNGVLGMLEVLERSRLNEQQAELVRTARDSGRTLLGIIDDILDFSKIEAGRLQVEAVPMSVADVVESLCDSLVPVANRQEVDLSVFVAPAIPAHVLSDPLRMRQILFNLLGNAIKFSGGRGERRGRVALRVTVEQDSPLRLAFTVTDNGIGMTANAVERLFAPFTQAEASTTRRFGGTGLGLTICKRLADLMEGRLTVSSRPGAGSTFTLTLPLEVPAEQPSRALTDLSGVECVLLESAELDFDGIAAYVEAAGARVHRVANMADGDRLAERAAGPVVAIRYRSQLQPLPTESFRCAANVRHLFITRGRRRRSRIEFPQIVSLDGTALRRQALLRAVAVAAGRASPETVAEPAAMPPRAEPVTLPSVAQARARGQLILVAEDDEINRRVIQRQLELLGCAAEIAVNGAEALRMWRAGSYALLLTDLHMPEMDGYALVEAIRREESSRSSPPGRPLPIIALTANALRGEAERAKTIGMDEYLTKPLQLDQLRQVLQRWLPTPADGAPE